MKNHTFREFTVKRSVFIVALLFVVISNAFAVNFTDLNIANDDRLLFKADFEGQSGVFVSRLTDMSMRKLTAFPEKLYTVENGRTIIAINRFGAVRIPSAGGLPSVIPGYPSFTGGDVPLRGRLQDLAASTDGRWILYVEPVTVGYGNLLLINVSTGERRTVSERVELPASDFPAKWSPDSRFFVYAKGGRLFYFPINPNLSTIVDERFRVIGIGDITSVSWGRRGDFYYLTDNTLYRVINPELFTRAIYGDFLSVGQAAAVLPVNFDSRFDRFWVAPDSGSILINKGGKGFFFFLLNENNNRAAAPPVVPTVLPHVPIPFGARNFNVYWSAAGRVTVTYNVRNEVVVQRFEVNGNSIRALTQNGAPLSAAGALSPDETKIIFWGERGLELWDYAEWQLIQRLSNEKILSCAWIDNRQIAVGNSKFIESINISTAAYQRRIICLSTADDIGFEDAARGPLRILARVGTNWYATDERSGWVSVNSVQLRPVSFSSDRFRVFLEPQLSGPFRNVPLIRNLQSFGTDSLVARHTVNSAFTVTRQLPIALCFDLYDDASGLDLVLTALDRFNIKATFFLNGEFIRRNPLAAKAIADAGHEAASLFYAPIDLSDTRYRITREFISQGLARNEDEFNHATGRELTNIWHPPFYRSTELINSAAAAAGYFTAVRSIDPGDWLSRDESLRLNMRQIPPAEMIEQIMEKKTAQTGTEGIVIPVRLGLLPGGRDEYLFQRIEVLLDALIRAGCVIVPVSTVIHR